MSEFKTPVAQDVVKDYEILTPKDFFEDFSTHAMQASGRVLAQTMYVEDGWALGTVADALMEAQGRGLDTALHVDAYSQLIENQNIHWVPRIHASARRAHAEARSAKFATLATIAGEGVSVTITNPPNIIEKTLPFVGRNHIKLALVDDIAWIGGLSYRDDDLDREDFMMRVADPDVVGALEEVFHTTDYTTIRDDKVFDFGDTKVVWDSGRRGQSAIFDRGLGDVRDASDSVRLISQYNPNGKMAAALALQAAMGRDVLSITSSRHTISEWFGTALDRVSTAYSRMQGQVIPTAHSKIRVHAKALLVDANNPDRAEGMVGSHNLTRTGVILGTQEVALFSSKPEFIQSLRNYFAKVEGRIALEQSATVEQ